MLKLILRNRCSLCSAVIGNIQISPHSIRNYGFADIDLDEFKQKYWVQHDKRVKKNEEKVRDREVTIENIESIKSILEKYNISTDSLKNNSSIFKESPWIIEQRIMLLQELGATSITLKDIQKFIMQMFLPVRICKANFAIKSDINLARNIFSWIDDNCIFTRESLSKFDETMPMRTYYVLCFVEYLKSELKLDEGQVNCLLPKKSCPVLYNSFRLLNRVLKLVKDDLQFTTDFIIKNRWLLREHPQYLETSVKIVENSLHEVSHKIFLKYPKILVCDRHDLELLLSYLKKYQITPKMIGVTYQILKLKPDELKRRIEVLSKIPFTLIYLRHPRFLVLVKHFHTVLPRIRFLESKNFKFASVNTLTTYHNYLENLSVPRKTTRVILKSFCDSIFREDADKLMQRIQVHPCWMFVSPVQMYESLMYLKEIFSTEVIYNHIYAILYNKTDLEVAREALIEHLEYSKLPPDQFLSLIVYKIEERCNFSGEAVLSPETYAKISKDEFDQDGTVKLINKEH